MNHSSVVRMLFSQVSRETAGLCLKLQQGYFGSFAVCVHMETELREIVFLINRVTQPVRQGQKGKPASLISQEVGYYGSDM